MDQPDLNQDLLTAFIDSSTVEVFDTMIMLPVSREQRRVDEVKQFSDSVSGMVALTGHVRGVLAVHCPNPVALAITANLLGDQPAGINDDVKDTIGELINMIAGGVKCRLLDVGTEISIAIPSVCAGHDYSLNIQAQSAQLLLPFEIAVGTFLVELRMVRGH